MEQGSANLSNKNNHVHHVISRKLFQGRPRVRTKASTSAAVANKAKEWAKRCKLNKKKKVI